MHISKITSSPFCVDQKNATIDLLTQFFLADNNHFKPIIFLLLSPTNVNSAQLIFPSPLRKVKHAAACFLLHDPLQVLDTMVPRIINHYAVHWNSTMDVNGTKPFP